MFIHLAVVAADLVILAIYTGKITAAEKYVANAIDSADYRFFAMMNADGTDIESSVTSANSGFTM
jgi:hypothetical protein